MAKKNQSGSGFIVYSTDPNYKPNDLSSLFGGAGGGANEDDAPKANNKQQVRIWLERIRGNKEATVIKGLDLNDDKLDELAKQLKNKCAAGGNAKDGEIIIQGNHRDKVLKMLLDMGFTNAKKAGG